MVFTLFLALFKSLACLSFGIFPPVFPPLFPSRGVWIFWSSRLTTSLREVTMLIIACQWNLIFYVGESPADLVLSSALHNYTLEYSYVTAASEDLR